MTRALDRCEHVENFFFMSQNFAPSCYSNCCPKDVIIMCVIMIFHICRDTAVSSMITPSDLANL